MKKSFQENKIKVGMKNLMKFSNRNLNFLPKIRQES